MDDLIFLDCEVYQNYFLVIFKNFKTNKKAILDIKGKNTTFTTDSRRKLYNVLACKQTCGFNSHNYDLPVLLYAIAGKTCEEIYTLSKYIIENNLRYWQLKDKLDINYDIYNNNIDIMEPTPGVAVSLKLYGARIHFDTLQDLPIKADAILTDEQIAEIKRYCENDVNLTKALFDTVRDRIELRKTLSDTYHQNLLSKSDAQVAEAIILNEFKKRSNKSLSKPKISDGVIKYKAPDYIRFSNRELASRLEYLESEQFKLNDKGHITAPKALSEKININGLDYKIGIGGLHSCEKKRTIKPNDNELLIDKDVASYYPTIIKNLKLYPKSLGPQFLDVYNDLIMRRLDAKKKGDKVVADSLKIALNGTFGKFANCYSYLYSPELMLNVTLTGQLCLLLLIEKLTIAGINVISANTDGIVSLMDKSQYDLFDSVCLDWQLETGLMLEETRYRALHNRDVNNYIAITENGQCKNKGVYAETGLMKNAKAEIINIALNNYLSKGIAIEETINTCTDIRPFIIVRNVTGGAKWKEQYLGRVARWVYTNDGDTIHYVKNGNKVAESDFAQPVMQIGEIPKYLNRNYYIDLTNKALNLIGG